MMGITINMYGDLRFRLGYLGEEDEPCLFLYRKGLLKRCAAIPLSAAWKYYPEMSERGIQYEHIDHMKETLVSASSICKALDMNTDRKTVTRMIFKIQDILPKLLALPPRINPVEDAVRAQITMDGRTYEASGADTQRDNLGIKVAS